MVFINSKAVYHISHGTLPCAWSYTPQNITRSDMILENYTQMSFSFLELFQYIDFIQLWVFSPLYSFHIIISPVWQKVYETNHIISC